MIGAAIVGGVLLAGVLLIVRSRSIEVQAPAPAPLWPPFTITFTVWDLNSTTGRVFRDETWRAVVQSERAWRAEVLRDGVHAKGAGSRAGSSQELRDGIVYAYDAEGRRQIDQWHGEDTAVAGIIYSELDPTLLPKVRSGGMPGWRLEAAPPNGRVVIVKAGIRRCAEVLLESLLCRGEGETYTVETRIEYDRRSPRGGYIGGAAVSGESKINGQVVHTFRAESLEFP